VGRYENKDYDKTLERLSSGLRINSGADDASGLAISEKMAAQNAGLLVAHQNVQDGQALYKIAEGALNQVSSMLVRMEELAVRATNGTLTTSDRSTLMDEVGELRDQINLISQTTEYNTLKVLNGSMAVESHLSEDTNNVNTGAMRITDKPGTVKTGEYYFSIVATAEPAMHVAAEVTSAINTGGMTTSGLINVNGIDVSISTGDSVATVASKINEVSDQTGVIVTLGAGGTGFSQLAFITGELDDDAKNIDTTTTNIIGYANQGADQQIKISGKMELMRDLQIDPAGALVSVTGTDAAGRIQAYAGTVPVTQGVDMISDGTSLKSSQHGSGTYGLEIDTDLYNGGKGVYIQNGKVGAATVTHRSTASDESIIDLDISKRLRLQTGANTNQSIYNGIENISSAQLGIGGASKYGSLDDIDLTSSDNANISLKVVQKAIVDITGLRSKIGATMNRLEYTGKTLSIQHENLTAAQSRIQDADMSTEMAEYTKQQILIQTGTAMLSQANSRPQSVLSLLQ
jgi:flagellin